MKEKRISFCQGNGSLGCNNREFLPKDVNKDLIKNNIIFVQQDLNAAYNHLFEQSTIRYNEQQIRDSRRIKGTYFQHLFHKEPSKYVLISADKRKSFYEDIVQIGNKEDSGFESDDSKLVTDCLVDYINGFQSRNPNLYVFNAVIHLDQATPHLHIDYIPFGHFTRGQDIQNSLSQALYEMGHGKDKRSIARWREDEIRILNQICLNHGIQPLKPEKHRESISVAEYKEYKKIQKLRLEEEQKFQNLSNLIDENNRLKIENEKLKEAITNLGLCQVKCVSFFRYQIFTKRII